MQKVEAGRVNIRRPGGLRMFAKTKETRMFVRWMWSADLAVTTSLGVF